MAVDASFIPLLERQKIAFKDNNNQVKPILNILSDAGVNTIRIRLWHSPRDDDASLTQVATLAARIREAGMKVWLSLHYSDTWADPGHQATPSAWEGLSLSALSDSIYNYTEKVVREIEPDIIQIGNEINSGFVHPQGEYTESNINSFITLLGRGVDAVRGYKAKNIKIMLHYAGVKGALDFFEKIKAVDYDLIGISYYSVYHTHDLSMLRSTLTSLRQTYSKGVYVAETAYPFTLEWNDNTHNVVGTDSQLLSDFEASPEGQASFLRYMLSMCSEVSPTQSGLCYWGADYVAHGGRESTQGSSWENMALFDFQFRALPALEAFSGR